MKLKAILPVLIGSMLTISCGGGGDGASGGNDYNPDTPLPSNSRTFVYISNNLESQIWVYPVDTAGNPSFVNGKITATDINLTNPYYILINDDYTIAYIADAPAKSIGKVYACGINSTTGALESCRSLNISAYYPTFERPLSLAIYKSNGTSYLYATNSVKDINSSGNITKCALSADGLSVTSCNQTGSVTSIGGVYKNLSPYGVTISGNRGFATFICLNSSCTSTGSNNYGLIAYDIDSNGNLVSPQKSSTSSQLTTPSDVVANNGILYVSNTASNSIAQYSNSSLEPIGSPVSTIFVGNYQLTINQNLNVTYIANSSGTVPGVAESNMGYISKCNIDSSNSQLVPGRCASLYYQNLQQPYAVAVTKTWSD